MILKTERLILRPIDLSDAQDIYIYSSEPNVGPNAGWAPHKNIEDTIETMKEIFLDADNVFGIVLKDTGRMIGSIGLIPDPKRENRKARMLGYAISENHWGNGYMTEAAKAVIEYGFTLPDIHLISAYCYPHNKRSSRVLQKLGFVYEGTLSCCEELYNGEILDNICYALQRDNNHT